MSSTLPASPIILDATGIQIVTKLKGIINAINNSGGGGGSMPSWFPPEDYDSDNAYSIGDIVYKDDYPYRCKEAVAAQSAWDATKWDQITNFFADYETKPGTIVDGTEVFGSGNTIQPNSNATAAHMEGQNNTIGTSSTTYCYRAHVEGLSNTVSNSDSHAEGYYNTVSGARAHAEGAENTASNTASHAEGEHTTASGYNAHSEGNWTTASGYYAHAEGANTTASGESSHAGGRYANVSGNYSFGHGSYVKTTNANEVAFGTYNNSSYNTVFSIGNGVHDTVRRNLFEVLSTGVANLNGHKVITDVQVPDPPASDGTYTLQCTVSNGTVTYAWV